MNSLFVTYLRDLYAVRFQFEKIKNVSLEDNFCLLSREEAHQEFKEFIDIPFFVFRRNNTNKKRGHFSRIFDMRLIKNIQSCRFDKVYILMHSRFGLAALSLVIFALLLNIPQIILVSLLGDKVKLSRKDVLSYIIKQQFSKGVLNYWLSRLSLALHLSFCLGKPVYLTVEPSNICNLKCPICRTGIGKLSRKQGLMDLPTFRKAIDRIAGHTNTILLYGSGEPFLNKDIYQMIKYVKSKNIYVQLCTNGQEINAEQLVESGSDEIGFAVGGGEQQAHQVYRVNSDLETLWKNVDNVISQRQKAGVNNPAIIIDLVVQKHNESQIEDVFKRAMDRGVDSINFTPTIVWDVEQAKKFASNNSRYNRYDQVMLNKGILRKNVSSNKCFYPWFGMIIQWDGFISCCCGTELPIPVFDKDKGSSRLQWEYEDNFYPIGNILERGRFNSIWNGKKMRALRRSLIRSKDSISICRLCYGYDAPSLYRS